MEYDVKMKKFYKRILLCFYLVKKEDKLVLSFSSAQSLSFDKNISIWWIKQGLWKYIQFIVKRKSSPSQVKSKEKERRTWTFVTLWSTHHHISTCAIPYFHLCHTIFPPMPHHISTCATHHKLLIASWGPNQVWIWKFKRLKVST